MISFDKEYYNKLMETNGYNPFEFGYFDFNLGKLSPEELQIRFLCHHNGDKFIKLKNKLKPSIVTTGFGMSGAPHIGTISQLIRVLKLNKGGIDTQIVLGDLDAYCGKKIDLKKTLEYKEKYELFINKLGYYNKPGSVLRGQLEEPGVLLTSYLAGSYMNDDMFNAAEEDLHTLYASNNKVDKNMSYRRKTSLALMIGDFIDLGLSNKYSSNTCYSNICVMLGVDEHKYVKFGQEALNNIKNGNLGNNDYFNKDMEISAIYTPIIKGFNNFPKQSKSFPESSINTESNIDDVYKKILDKEGNYSGPEDNVVYQMMMGMGNYDVNEYKKIYEICKEGGNKRKKQKKQFADYLIDILGKWDK